ncbi:MAG: hypothetical protein RR988_05530 [Clostridia bacterium]
MNKDTKKGLLYLESFIYVAAVLLAVYMNEYGGFYIKTIPILFITGILGKVVFDRPIITTCIGCIFNTFIIYTISGVVGKENILSTFFVGIMILSGEIVGEIFYRIYLNSKEKKKGRKKKVNKVMQVLEENKFQIEAASFIAVTLFLHNFVNGNLIEKINEKNIIEKYIAKTYKEEVLEVKDVALKLSVNSREYEFTVKDLKTNNMYYMSKRKNGYIEDTYKQYVDSVKKINKKKQIQEVLEAKIKEDASYRAFKISNTASRIVVQKSEVNNNDETLKLFASEVYQIINSLKASYLLEDIDFVNVILNTENNKETLVNSNVTFTKKIIYSANFSEKYILDGLKEEVIGVN